MAGSEAQTDAGTGLAMIRGSRIHNRLRILTALSVTGTVRTRGHPPDKASVDKGPSGEWCPSGMWRRPRRGG
jgi:hypothetical protein